VVECFLGDSERDGLPRPCIGVIIEYCNKRRAALGECHVGAAETVSIIAPTMLHLKPVDNKSWYSGAWFTSFESEARELQYLGWKGER
jgi:hypothetical protein